MPGGQRFDPDTLDCLVKCTETDLRAMEGRRAMCALCRETRLTLYLMELRVRLREAK